MATAVDTIEESSEQVAIHGALFLTSIGILLGTGGSGLGPAPIVLLFVGAVCCLFSLIAMGIRVLFLTTPGRSVVMSILFCIVAWQWPGQVGRELLPVVDGVDEPVKVIPVIDTAPRYAVNAYGGGLRAAVYTGLLLARLDDRSCGEFGRRLTVLSGVSGGSLGIAMYLSLRQDFVTGEGGDRPVSPID